MYSKVFIVILSVFMPLISAVSEPSRKQLIEAEFKSVPSLSDRLNSVGVKEGDPVFVRIFKSEAVLELWMQPDEGAPFVLFYSYPVCYFSGQLGPKTKTGDMQAPEGFYFVKPEHMNPYSRFKKSFNLGYPNSYDRGMGYTGGYLMVHGNCVSEGCYAMTDPQIEEIYTIVSKAFDNGQPFFRVHIFPFRLTDGNLDKATAEVWYDFWVMLKPGYDYFEDNKIPPDIIVTDKKYVIK